VYRELAHAHTQGQGKGKGKGQGPEQQEEQEQEQEEQELRAYVTDAIILHFLIARQLHPDKAGQMLGAALKWRCMRKPHRYFPRYAAALAELSPPRRTIASSSCSSAEGAGGVTEKDTEKEKEREKPLFGSESEEAKLRHEACTGKIYLAGFDAYQRQVVVFDNACQNTKNTAHNLDLLAFSLELATKALPEGRDKYVVFMHLDQFSFLNCPDMSTTKETALMLTTAFPERLGHCICYHPPRIFHTVFALLKKLGLVDERTLSKVILIYGDTSPGTANDAQLCDVIGPHWRQLVGIGQPVHSAGCSPGFVQTEYWARVRAVLQWLRRGGHDQQPHKSAAAAAAAGDELDAEVEEEEDVEINMAEEEWGLDGYESDTANLMVRCQHSPRAHPEAAAAANTLAQDQQDERREEQEQEQDMDMAGRYLVGATASDSDGEMDEETEAATETRQQRDQATRQHDILVSQADAAALRDSIRIEVEVPPAVWVAVISLLLALLWQSRLAIWQRLREWQARYL